VDGCDGAKRDASAFESAAAELMAPAVASPCVANALATMRLRAAPDVSGASAAADAERESGPSA